MAPARGGGASEVNVLVVKDEVRLAHAALVHWSGPEADAAEAAAEAAEAAEAAAEACVGRRVLWEGGEGGDEAGGGGGGRSSSG